MALSSFQSTKASSVEAVLRTAAASGRRIQRFEIDGQVVWVKRYDAERIGLGQQAHALLSRFLPASWRSSRLLDAAGLVAREVRKYRAFETAGFAVPHIVRATGGMLVIADAGPSIARILKRRKAAGEDDAHDDLLVTVAATLGHVHRAGLCLGRPHPRDMSLDGSRIVFFDFEEEPERVMPLEEAQARDVWLLFFQITALAIKPETPGRAFARYTMSAPSQTRRSLDRRMRSIRWVVPVGTAVSRIHLGSDLKRLLGATIFLTAAAVSPDTHMGPGWENTQPTAISRSVQNARPEDEDERRTS